MGVSTNAILFYGYCWSEEDVELFRNPEFGGDDDEGLKEGDSPEWTERVLLKRGEKNPWNNLPAEFAALPYQEKRKAQEKWIADHRAELDAWSAKKDAVEKEFDIVVSSHCSGDYSMPYLAANGSSVIACRGYPEEVDLATLKVDPEWNAKLDKFIAEFGIEKPHEKPTWWLVSYWD